MRIPVFLVAFLWSSAAQDEAGPRSPARTEYAIRVVPPDLRFNYTIVWIRPDPSVDYKIRVVDPGGQPLSPERGREAWKKWLRGDGNLVVPKE